MKLIVRLHGKVLENVGQTLKDKIDVWKGKQMLIGFK